MTDDQTQQAHQADRTQPTPGPRSVAGRYVLLGELGRGGMGVVWRAEDQVIGRQVAIKELRLPEGARDAGTFQERVLREVRTGGRLNDPAVVTVYDVVAEGDTTYIVMELVEAPTLSELVRRHGPMSAQQVAVIGEQVLAALQAAHEAGIVHRDVKPGNIMVTAGGRVKLTDFGIAQAVDDPRLTTSGMIVGSPAFMAPERVAGHEALPASDLWSLGATLFFAVEGLVAFERPTTAATLHAIMHEVPYLTHAQGPLASAIMGLLISSPDARLSAQQARGLLSMAGTQSGAPTPPGGQQTALYSGAAPTMVGGHTGPRPAPPDRTRRNLLLAGAAVAAVALLIGGLFLGKWIFEPAPDTDPAMLPTMTYGKGGDLSIDDRSYSCHRGQLRPDFELNRADCDEPHELEIYDRVTALGNNSRSKSTPVDYPPEQDLREFAETHCAMSFHTNTIKSEKRDRINYAALVPAQEEWERVPDSGDPTRQVLCVARAASGGQLNGYVSSNVR
ncbi:serine/threonine-protein kinase [Amycolatopsis cihanbeyliensis]|uniref:non-specific serine/threonine protein kinase n=1 Tax=Amycolatopsis cihanbeyliensis TaxID=1128664 RepID=A0A542CT71_AMYCI|nr:serine/threonine-protein kinase [Amycolatopsis cihanbeyliensis]TQI94021.1 serine/threonine protein kinase [Amycolatopsis cihanbeyliensis]